MCPNCQVQSGDLAADDQAVTEVCGGRRQRFDMFGGSTRWSHAGSGPVADNPWDRGALTPRPFISDVRLGDGSGGGLSAPGVAVASAENAT